MIRISMITFTTHAPEPLASWWAERLGGYAHGDSASSFWVVETPDSPVSLGFQLADSTSASSPSNQLHLDLDRSPDRDPDQVVAEWCAAGASHLARRGEPGASWDVFADPAGNLFCIGDPHE